MAIRSKCAAIIRRFHALPALATIISLTALFTVLLLRAENILVLAAAALVALSAYVWGYSRRALKHVLWPPLNHLQRRSYAEVWDSIAISRGTAAVAVSGQADEAELRASAEPTVRNLVELAHITPSDEILEIGCGVARIGLELAGKCRRWTGVDTSANLLSFAKERIQAVRNMSLVQLRQVGLSEISDGSFDIVYSTNVFPHLDEIDRWLYVREAFRVLRAAGRLFIDNVDLESDAGWTMFANDAARFARLERPPYMPWYSTAAELMVYAYRAGFEHVEAHHRAPLVIVTALKS